jgi:hypothetical protein
LDVNGDNRISAADVDAVITEIELQSGQWSLETGLPELSLAQSEAGVDGPDTSLEPDEPVLPEEPGEEIAPPLGPSPPIISMYVDDAVAAEENQDPGQVTFTRSGPVDEPLTVQLWIHHHTKNERGITTADYSGISDSILFPVGAGSVTYTILPVEDAVIEEHESLEISIRRPDRPMTTSPWIPPYWVNPEREEGAVLIKDNEWRWVRPYDGVTTHSTGTWSNDRVLSSYPYRELRSFGSWQYGPRYNEIEFTLTGGMLVQGIFIETSYGVSDKLTFTFQCDPTTGVITGGPSGQGVTRNGPVEGGTEYTYQIDDDPNQDLHTVGIDTFSRVAGGGSYSIGASAGGGKKGGQVSFIYTENEDWGNEVTNRLHKSLMCRKGPEPR